MEIYEKELASGYCYLKFEKDSIKVLCLSNKGFFIGDWEDNSIDDYVFINWSSDLTHTANMIGALGDGTKRVEALKIIVEFEDGLWDVCPIQKVLNTTNGKLNLYIGNY